MFQGLSVVNIDSKGRLAISAKFRDIFNRLDRTQLILTLNPWDRSLFLYPIAEWEHIASKIALLSDFDKGSRRTKQILTGYATECRCDSQGRVLIPAELRSVSDLDKEVILLGQANKLELWNAARWRAECEEWLAGAKEPSGNVAPTLESLSL
jgi:MraZ protein